MWIQIYSKKWTSIDWCISPCTTNVAIPTVKIGSNSFWESVFLNAKWSIISCWKSNLFCDDNDNDNSGLLTLPEHLSWPLVFSGVRVTRSLVLYICFVDIWMSFRLFSFGHYVVCSSSIYIFWLPLWYLQTLLAYNWWK